MSGNPIVDTGGVLQTLSQLAGLRIPAVNEAILPFLTCFDFGNTDPTASKQQLEDPTSTGKDNGRTNKITAEEINIQQCGCGYCDEVFSSRSSLEKHVKNDHPSKRRRLVNSEVFQCNNCDAEFATETSLRNHQNNATCSNAPSESKQNKCRPHKDVASNPKDIVLTPISEHAPSNCVKGTENKNSKWRCDWCHKDLSNKGNLKRHILSVHAAKSPKTPKKRTFADRNYDKVDDTEFRSKINKPDRRTARDTSSAETGECSVCHKTIVGIFEHYRNEHNVELIRKDPGSDSKTKTKCKAADSSTAHKSLLVGTENKGVIVYQCETCETATSTYDACVEHAQLHHAGCRQITETCRSCKLMFEPQCFAAHSSNCTQDTERKILRYNPSDLLNDDWFNMFQGLPDAVANQIKSSSVYEHTRAIKINSAEVSGIPLYQCGVCELYVHPKEVEEHCNSQIDCVTNKSQNHYCSICKICFYSSGAISEHHKDHNDVRGNKCFRTVTFNCREDATVNRALKEHQKSHSSIQAIPYRNKIHIQLKKSPVGTQQGKTQQIEIIDDRMVTVFCEYCKKSIMYYEYENHAAAHRNVFLEDCDRIVEENEEGNRTNNDKDINTTAIASQNKLDTGGTNEGDSDRKKKRKRSRRKVEQGKTDDNSSHSLQVIGVQGKVHKRREEDRDSQNNNEELAAIAKQNQNNNGFGDVSETNGLDNSENSSVSDHIQVETNACSSQGMAMNLKSKLRSLFKGNKSLPVKLRCKSVPDSENLTTQELISILES